MSVTSPPASAPQFRRRKLPVPAETLSAEDAPHPPHRSRVRLALLCVLVILGPLAALQLRSGDDDREAASPAARATATPAQNPRPSAGVDLSIPLLVLVELVPLVLVIRETRRGGRD